MRIKHITTLIILFVLATTSNAVSFGIAKINITVVDESREPMDDTKIRARFSSGEMPKITRTDDQGFVNITGTSNDGVIVGTAIKDGYYDTTFHHDFYRTRFGMWQPWGKALTVVMRPIVNPVPMYEVDKFFKLPIVGEEVGFDLEKSDWVIPHGQGTHADFVFKIERILDDGSNYDATMTLTFSNPFDGIQIIKDDGGGDFNTGSVFRLPRYAPEAGYQAKLQKRTSKGTYGRHSDNFEDNNYFFRVRSEIDENGNLKRAMYGKIRGDLKFSPLELHIGMDYYLNPDYTRNLEFDYKRNLFKPVSDER